ncbi:hypothetical protein A4X09_0g1046 [Tilletia walkeri]|uniref:Uncharacterized protein n=1 Tax=Tilletia walkeri TaxID=117179 RepID=A0A8X7NDX9_9BASI|nr:hypothetical protein A4X09_0g1046 [Tilletia walkeri]
MERQKQPTVRALQSGKASDGPPSPSGSTVSTLRPFRLSSASLGALPGSIMQMFGKGAAALSIPLKRRRDDVEDGEDEQSRPASKLRARAAVSDSASQQVMPSSTMDSRPAEAVAQKESPVIPEGRDLVGTSALPCTTPIHPPPSAAQASMADPSPIPGPPSVSTGDFNKAMDDLNTDIKAAVEKFRKASTAASASTPLSTSQGHLSLNLHGFSGTGTTSPSLPQQESLMIPGGWDLVGISGSPCTTPIYPPLSSVQGSIADPSSMSAEANPPASPQPASTQAVSKDISPPFSSAGYDIYANEELIQSALKTIYADVSQEMLGLPVKTFQNNRLTVDKDYPDYGQPSIKVYATGEPPWIYASVDFTDPLDPFYLALPTTFQRMCQLRSWLSLCWKMATEANRSFPSHLRTLYTILDIEKFSRQSSRCRRLEATIKGLAQKDISANVAQILDATKLTWLPSALPTNDGPMCFFLYDAPLKKYAPIHYSDEETLQILQASGWSPRTVLVRAQDIAKIRNWPRLHVHDAGAWRAQKQAIDDLLKSAVQSRQA